MEKLKLLVFVAPYWNRLHIASGVSSPNVQRAWLEFVHAFTFNLPLFRVKVLIMD